MTHATLVQALQTSEDEVSDFFGTVHLAEFTRPLGDGWSPAEHFDHLNISVSATARGFGMSRLLLRVRFGRAGRPSRTFEQLRADYLALLAAGGIPAGAFAPRKLENVDAAGQRAALLARWRRVNARLRTALSSWSERNLDRLQFPHPLLGRITGRELVMFTIYHGLHHISAVKRRQAQAAADGNHGGARLTGDQAGWQYDGQPLT